MAPAINVVDNITRLYNSPSLLTGRGALVLNVWMAKLLKGDRFIVLR